MTSPKPFGVYPPTNLNLQNLIKAQRNLAPSDFFFLVNWSYLLDVYAYDHNISVVGKPKLLSFYHFKRRETFAIKVKEPKKGFCGRLSAQIMLTKKMHMQNDTIYANDF